MSKSRVYHYDTTYEQEAEDGTVTASVELRIHYTVTPAGGDDWNEPRYPAQAEFYGVGEEIVGGKPRAYRDLAPNKSKSMDMQAMFDDTLYWWAEAFVDNHQDALLIAAGEDDEADADCAREMRDEMLAEARRDAR